MGVEYFVCCACGECSIAEYLLECDSCNRLYCTEGCHEDYRVSAEPDADAECLHCTRDAAKRKIDPADLAKFLVGGASLAKAEQNYRERQVAAGEWHWSDARAPPPRSVAVLGAGRWGRNIVRELHAGQQLRTVCDLDAPSLQAVRSRYPDVHCTPRLEEVLSDPEIDVVCVATPMDTHYELASKVLRAGKHVYVEKPLCTTSDEARKLVRLADESGGLRVFTGHILHYHPSVVRLFEWLWKHPDERVAHVSCERAAPARGPHPTALETLWDLAPHDVSLALRLMDPEHSDDPETSAVAATSTDAGVAEVCATLTFAEGACAVFHWGAGVSPKRSSVTVYTKGYVLHFDDVESQAIDKLTVTERATGDRHVFPEVADDWRSPLEVELEVAMRYLRSGQSPPPTAMSEGATVVECIERVERALESQPA